MQKSLYNSESRLLFNNKAKNKNILILLIKIWFSVNDKQYFALFLLSYLMARACQHLLTVKI